MKTDYSTLTPALFPTAEDDQFEFKSSLTTDSQIKDKLPYAVSAIANSGGGIFFWGLNKTGSELISLEHFALLSAYDLSMSQRFS
jgi:predicted HTH transcriptional regulator